MNDQDRIGTTIALWVRLLAVGVITFLLSSGVFFVLRGSRQAQRTGERVAPVTDQGALVVFPNAQVVLDIAADAASRERGLSGRAALAKNEGLLSIFPEPGLYPVSMVGMRFPVDIIWIAGDRVAALQEHAAPPVQGAGDVPIPVYHSPATATAILQVPAGFIAAHQVRAGDQIQTRFGVKNLLRRTAVESLSQLPGSEYFIDTLKTTAPRGSDFRVEKLLSETPQYRKYQVFYRAGTLQLSGVMNVPRSPSPSHGFPVLILNHGLIRKEIYYSGRGSRREQDFFARHGFVTIHPDYRGYGLSDPDTAVHHDFYVGYTTDVLAAIDAVEGARLAYVDTTKIGMWGHSMGGGIAARIMVLRHDIKAFVLFAPISADAYENFYELQPSEVAWLKQTYGENPSTSRAYAEISPATHFGDITAPVQLHHGTVDTLVPLAFSREMYDLLRSYGKTAAFYTYDGEPHEFGDAWQVAADRSLQFFEKYVKE